jgi:nucleoprotein TPR
MAVDVSSISSFASIPTSTVSTLLENPTIEFVTSLLQGIATKIQEYEQLKAQKFRLEVELETSVRTSESKIKVLKTSVDKALAESSRLRVDLQNSGEQRLYQPF